MPIFTREMDFQQLTATTSEQEISLIASYRRIIIRVTSAGAVRLQINDTPSDFSSTKGIYVDDNQSLELVDHIVHKIKYIRDSNSSVDVNVEIIGLYREGC